MRNFQLLSGLWERRKGSKCTQFISGVSCHTAKSPKGVGMISHNSSLGDLGGVTWHFRANSQQTCLVTDSQLCWDVSSQYDWELGRHNNICIDVFIRNCYMLFLSCCKDTICWLHNKFPSLYSFQPKSDKFTAVLWFAVSLKWNQYLSYIRGFSGIIVSISWMPVPFNWKAKIQEKARLHCPEC